MDEFYLWPKYLIDVRDIDPADKIVYVLILGCALANAETGYTKDYGKCFAQVTAGSIAEITHRCPDAVRDSIKRLCRIGLLEKKHVPGYANDYYPKDNEGRYVDWELALNELERIRKIYET